MVSSAPIVVTLIGSVAVCGLVAWIGTRWYVNFALRRRVFDVPNERSMHSVPTPRGGGLPIVASVMATCFALWQFGFPLGANLLASLAPAWVVAAVGFADDLRGVSTRARLLTQLSCAAASLAVLRSGFETPLAIQIGDASFGSGWFALGFALLFVAWMSNLYNFMDGIDGIAATQVVSVASVAALWTWRSDAPGLCAVYSLLAAASFGFLLLNWHPARVFMGDVGSEFFGFTLGLLAVYGIWTGVMTLAGTLLLHGAFLVDTGYTLVVRSLRGKRPHDAHRTHCYQKLARAGCSHPRICYLYVLINFLWLSPLAILALMGRLNEWLALGVALMPLTLGCRQMMAGADEIKRPLPGRLAKEFE